jgi:hypothetical protein
MAELDVEALRRRLIDGESVAISYQPGEGMRQHLLLDSEARAIIDALARIPELERELAENEGVMKALRRQRDEAEKRAERLEATAREAMAEWESTYSETCGCEKCRMYRVLRATLTDASAEEDSDG